MNALLFHPVALYAIGITLLLVSGGLKLVRSNKEVYSGFIYRRAVGAIVVGIPLLVALIYFNRV